MLRDHALAKLFRQWGFAISAGVIVVSIGIAGIYLFHTDGIFRILTNSPAVSLSMILALDAVAADTGSTSSLAFACDARCRARRSTIVATHDAQATTAK